MRERLETLLKDFAARRIQIFELHSKLEALIKAGVANELSREESKAVRNLFDWGLDMYDPNEQPRCGIVGKLRDLWDQVFNGTYRVSEDEIRRMCDHLFALLHKGREC